MKIDGGKTRMHFHLNLRSFIFILKQKLDNILHIQIVLQS